MHDCDSCRQARKYARVVLLAMNEALSRYQDLPERVFDPDRFKEMVAARDWFVNDYDL